MGGGGPSPTMMQINPSQLSNAQAAMGVGGSQMGPPTGMTAPGRMGGVVGPTNPTGQWMNRGGISLPQCTFSHVASRANLARGVAFHTTQVLAPVGRRGPRDISRSLPTSSPSRSSRS
jgi:hypothetical protein